MDYCISMLFGVVENEVQIESALIISLPSFENDKLLHQALDEIIAGGRKHIEENVNAKDCSRQVFLISCSIVKL